MPSLEPAPASFLDDAPFRIVARATVLAPIDVCWELIVDQASWVRWFEGISSVDATPWIWTEPGQTRTVKVNRLKVDEVAISIEPETEYAFTIVKWPLPTAKRAAEGLRLEDRTKGGSPRTTITYIGAFESTRLGKFAEGLLTKQLTAAWTEAIKNLGALAATEAASRS